MPAPSLPNRLDHIVRDALAGDEDAVLVLAREEPEDAFLPWLARFMPTGKLTSDLFELWASTYERVELERALDTLEET
jgi:hypothetical protein